MDTVRSNDGTPIVYERNGTGPALVLVHGTTADHTRWQPVLPMLQQQFTVYAVDRRGRGQSGDSTAYSLEREYDDIAAVVSSIPEPVNLLGHSYGALICLEAALRVTNLNRLVLYEPSIPVGMPIYPPGARAKIQALLDAGDREGVLLAFYRDVVEIPEHQIAVLRKEPAWAARVAAARTIPREFSDEGYIFEPSRFKNLDVPILLLQGENSPDYLKAATEAVHAALPNSRIVVMPGQQHIAISTAPELFARLVIEFLLSPAESVRVRMIGGQRG
ncbi:MULTISPECIES: alpha/beta hydrolase [unclassified Methanoculleus]|uniref:alpha/beta fold hydrolase n=1 Tax=unclassified Methanoculleus TaxID=2619537 RepID=UPI0025D74599|nr:MULTISPECIES: alpha/beta hydrolase [unclassified Methanoculleus]MCK9316810.1 alpha/beta hydrolase [Methanoculleus sp.]MDD2252729.1 alpha/beta hydrolase [Methanoculleus sp.]MDD2786452.1 alpha/beta hydrolase [Methanoculleus sp.]MDD3215288.1 alpha/beta hydrolase [Methanoculleus sp.]MDD4312972.1 alpha/beta hydrolase [Methanoculleus sp.]